MVAPPDARRPDRTGLIPRPQCAILVGESAQFSLVLTGVEYPEVEPFARARRGGISSGNLGNGKDFVQTVTDVARRHANASRLLFSSEFLFRWIKEDGQTLATLQKSFDVTVVLFTREFLAHAISGYGQTVKRGGCTTSLEEHLAVDRHPHAVLRVLEAIERSGCSAATFNYSRHSDHLLDIFAGAVGVALDTLVLPPVARVNRSLDETELALARCFNAVLGKSSSKLVADALCEKLPLHPTGTPRISRQDYQAYRERVAPIEATINPFLPPSERYGVDEPILIEDGTDGVDRVMGVTEAQLDVLAQSLGREIVRLRASKPDTALVQDWALRTIRAMVARFS